MKYFPKVIQRVLRRDIYREEQEKVGEKNSPQNFVQKSSQNKNLYQLVDRWNWAVDPNNRSTLNRKHVPHLAVDRALLAVEPAKDKVL